MRNGLYLVFVLWLLVAGLKAKAQQVVQYVEPMAGSGAATTPAAVKHGSGLELHANTIPAVTMPFAMTQWTPQTQTSENKCVPPYYYKDEVFSGIRASHWLSGSCTQDYGSVTIMPISGKLKTSSAAYGAKFSHNDERATPYQYDLDLKKYNILVSVTSTERCGIIRFTAKKTDSIYILITPNSDFGKANIKFDEQTGEIYGANPVHRIYQGWGKEAGFDGHFVMKVNRKIGVSGTFSENQVFAAKSISNQKAIGVYVGFKINAGETIQIRVGTSFSNLDGARKNLRAEISNWNFDQVSAQNKAVWEKTLSQIELKTTSVKDKKIFYTSYYHVMQQPRLYNDVDGTYPMFAAAHQLAKLKTGNYYDDFSLWDTYRAHLPLLEILQPEMVNNVVRSLIIKGQQGGYLPIFPCWNSYTSEMIGDHCSSVISSAYLKGINKFDVNEAYRLMRQNAFNIPASRAEYVEGKGRRALDSYLKYGYIPVEDSVKDAFHQKEQVSRVLEYAYDDYALAQVAKKIGKTNDYQLLIKRSSYYKNVFDPESKLVRGRHTDGTWVLPFRPDSKEYYITEGTPRQYTFYVPHDVHGLSTLMGGRKQLENALDTLFARNEYWHGNEPGHQTPFMYNFTGAAWKTQKTVRQILEREYSDGPGGLSGNDDAGQMSAWYMFASLGLYPVNPVSGAYQLCSPIFDQAKIKLGNGKTIEIKSYKKTSSSIYIYLVKWNGKVLNKNYITYAQLNGGGKLEIFLQEKPELTWGSGLDKQAIGLSAK